jgi:predicted Fe-S protein YdhL (DUF1289 family)
MDAPSGLCKGCWRSMDEIIAWGALDDADKEQVWTLIEQRQKEVVFSSHPSSDSKPSLPQEPRV